MNENNLPKTLRTHLDLWRSEKIIDEGTALKMAEASLKLLGENGSQKTLWAGMLLAAALILGGLTMIVAENWQAIPEAIKFLGWGAIQTGFMIGWGITHQRNPEKSFIAELFSWLAGGWIMVGIALMGQVFQLDSRFSDGFWLWAVLLAPMLYFAPTQGGQFWMMIATAFALSGEVTEWAKNGEGMMIGSFAIPVIAALIAAVISQSHLAVWRGWITFGFLSVCYFWWSVLGWISENHYSKKLIELASNSPRILLLILPVLIGSLWKSEVIFSPTLKRQTLGWIGGLISLPWILGLISVHTSEELGRTLTVVLCWSAQIGVSFLLIRDGLREYAKGWVNIGYLMLFISLVQRYFDLFEKFGFLKSGLGFILSGIFLLGLLFLMNRSRKSLFEKYAKESL